MPGPDSGLMSGLLALPVGECQQRGGDIGGGWRTVKSLAARLVANLRPIAMLRARVLRARVSPALGFSVVASSSTGRRSQTRRRQLACEPGAQFRHAAFELVRPGWPARIGRRGTASRPLPVREAPGQRFVVIGRSGAAEGRVKREAKLRITVHGKRWRSAAWATSPPSDVSAALNKRNNVC